MRRLAHGGAVVAFAVLSACTDSRPASKATEPGPSLATQEAVTTTTTTAPPQPVLRKVGEAFVLDGLRLRMLSVQDPFPSSPQSEPAAGNRLVSIMYEAVSQNSASRNLSDLPAVELRDSSGSSYRSEHGRLSMVSGARGPGELPAGTSMQRSAVFEIPGSATGLRVAFRPLSIPGDPGVVVTLD